MKILSSDGVDGGGADNVSFYLSSDEESPASRLPFLGALPTPSAQEVNVQTAADFALTQIRLCGMEHGHLPCSREDSSPMPSRVLSIGVTSESPIRLIESGSLHAPYAILSHCWGPTQPLKTTKASMFEMLDRVEWTRLPIVFCEAIEIARRLGLEYIWIDSLCIIQDDREDWEIEASRMAHYYEMSYLTIASASSPNHGTSFLRPPDHAWWPVYFVLRHRSLRRWDWIRATREIINDEDQGPLLTRAWTLQEGALSRRTIYFMRQGIVWSCPGGLQEQNRSYRVSALPSVEILSHISQLGPAFDTGRESLMHATKAVTEPTLQRGLQSTEEHFKVWNSKILTAYSARNITRLSDRLPALSGIATRFHELLKCRYLAGLWESHLPYNLLWSVIGTSMVLSPPNRTVSYQPDEFVAPSWSWASVKDPVCVLATYEFSEADSHVSVVSVHVNVPGLNPFGEVSSGHLTLRGKCFEMMLSAEDPLLHNTYKVKSEETRGQWYVYPDCVLQEANGKLVRAKPSQHLSSFSSKVLCMYIASSALNDFALVFGPSEIEEGAFNRLAYMEQLTSVRPTDAFDRTREEMLFIL